MRAAHEAEGRAEKLAAQAAAWDAAPLLAVEPLDACLRQWGFLAGAGTGSLTPLGTAATEVNEGHPLLMPMLAESGRVAGFGAEELACVLAAFIREGGGSGSGDDDPTLADSGLSAAAMDTLYWLDEQVRVMQRDEDRAGVRDGPANFWQLSALWVCVTARYIAGAGLTEIASEFGLFEGNVQRGLLRVANLLEEWAAVCELRADLAGLEQVRGLRFLRDDIVVDSLYLRL
jgi:superfamily II RNA helicase